MRLTPYKLIAQALVLILVAANPALATAADTRDSEALTLITASPDEGFALAITLARRSVTTIQTEKKVLQAERPVYSGSAEDLIAASHVVAVLFDTIAQANDYWRE